VFFAKSAESLGNKGVEFLLSAKKCRRVGKSVKRKRIDRTHVEASAGLNFRMLRRGHTPHYMHECENKRVAKWAPRKCMKGKRRFLQR
jgi:hypothetical protein